MLYYHKCLHCLTAFASTEAHVDICDCEGPVMFMGRVHGDKWEKVEQRSVCDGRCTEAHGPHCDCECGGANHGTGRTVQTVVAEGKVKVVNPNDDILEEMKRGYKFRELRDAAENIYGKLFPRSAPLWSYEARVARSELNKALGLKIYDRRHNELITFILKYAPKLEKSKES